MKYCFLFCLTFSFFTGIEAQREPDKIYMQNIHSIKLYVQGNQAGYPIINLGSVMNLSLDFDDLEGSIKNYNYTYQLCDANWQPVNLNSIEYISGFLQGRLNQYRNSSIAKVKYTHYQALLPEKSTMPSKSGNYLLKVYLNGDTSKLAFTKRLLILENIVPIGASIQQPFNTQLFQSHQKVQFSIDKSKLDILNTSQQLKVVVLQNYRWDIAVTSLQPVFMRGNVYEYNGEQDCLFSAGREFRWADLRSFRFLSDRIDSVGRYGKPLDIYLRPESERGQMRYLYQQGLGGFYQISSTDVNNAWTQGDYANVHFTFVPQNNQPYFDQNIYLIGEMTGYQYSDKTKMEYNAVKGIYEKTLLLKEGFYNYTYATKNSAIANAKASTVLTDGNYWQTENTYTILVYYRSFSDRSDRLVGTSIINSLNVRR